MRKLIPFAAAVLFVSTNAHAIKTQYWTHSTEEEFQKGTPHNVVINNRGELRLSRETKSLLPADQHFDAIQAIAQAPDGAIIFGTFPDNKILSLKDGKLETLADLEDKTITTIFVDADGKILVGVAGEHGEILELGKANEKPKAIFTQNGVDYIWAIIRSADKLVIGTGPAAEIYELDSKGTIAKIAKLDGENVLALAASKDGTLFAGTGADGLIYRVDAKSRTPFLLFDAPEAEVSALAIDDKGNLLAATGEDKETAGETPTAESGRPEHGTTPSTIPSKMPASPKEGENGNDAEDTKPIPKENPAKPEAANEAAGANEPAAPPVPVVQPSNPSGGETPAQGNAVYRIDANGFTAEVYRGPVVIYSMLADGENILLGTGDEGKIVQINPATEEAVILARTDSAQVNGLVRAPDGSVYVATSNSGSILSMTSGYAKEGTYESAILDAGAAASFGNMHLTGLLPEGTSLTVTAHSGNSADPDTGGWSDWSRVEAAREYLPIGAPTARYVQYKLNFTTTDPKKTPGVDEITVAYQKPNVAPRIASVTITPPAEARSTGSHTITWEAADPNEDALQYAVYARVIGKPGWVELAKELTTNSFTWPGKEVVDGRYEVKVVATDSTDNQPGEGQSVSRISAAVTIDNTPPAIGDIAVNPAQDGIKVTVRTVDRTSTVASLDYAIDSATHWQRRLPDDTMADSPEERYTITLAGLAKGQHTLTVKATDQHGNVAFENVSVTAP